MKDTKKTILRLGLLAASAFAGLSAAVAGDSVKYIVYDENGKSTEMTATDCEQLTGDNKAKDLEHKKWYYVKGNVTYDGTLNLGSGTAHADVHIILCDGAKLTVKGSGGHAAISVRYGTLHDDYLYIYGQKHQTGTLIAEGGKNAAGIGGDGEAGDSNKHCSAGHIYIYGGNIIARGGEYAAGIGGGYKSNCNSYTSDFYFYGGFVHAEGGKGAAGIGGALNGYGPNYAYFYGGTVEAFGGGDNESSDSGKKTPAGIGNGAGKYNDTNKGLKIYRNGATFMSGSNESDAKKQDYTVKKLIHSTDRYARITWEGDENGMEKWAYVPYGNGSERVPARTINTTNINEIGWGGWYRTDPKDDMTRSGLTVNGTANLILSTNRIFHANGVGTPGISVTSGNTLNIYSPGDGQLVATGGYLCAGIGSGAYATSGTVNVFGGKVTALGGPSASGIGGGGDAKCGTVNISGGTVTAIGGDCGTGIGGGAGTNNEGRVTISGNAVVTAWGGRKGAGIGGGDVSQAASDRGPSRGITVVVSSGTVTAVGGYGGAGIGGGEGGAGGSLTVFGGTVTATGGVHAAGIGGGGDKGAGGTVKISGGTVTANAGEGGGTGIGGGRGGADGSPPVLATAAVALVEGGFGKGYPHAKVTAFHQKTFEMPHLAILNVTRGVVSGELQLTWEKGTQSVVTFKVADRDKNDYELVGKNPITVTSGTAVKLTDPHAEPWGIPSHPWRVGTDTNKDGGDVGAYTNSLSGTLLNLVISNTVSGAKMGDFSRYEGWKKVAPTVSTIEIAAGVTAIGENAFSGCDKVSTVVFEGKIPDVSSLTAPFGFAQSAKANVLFVTKEWNGTAENLYRKGWRVISLDCFEFYRCCDNYIWLQGQGSGMRDWTLSDSFTNVFVSGWGTTTCSLTVRLSGGEGTFDKEHPFTNWIVGANVRLDGADLKNPIWKVTVDRQEQLPKYPALMMVAGSNSFVSAGGALTVERDARLVIASAPGVGEKAVLTLGSLSAAYPALVLAGTLELQGDVTLDLTGSNAISVADTGKLVIGPQAKVLFGGQEFGTIHVPWNGKDPQVTGLPIYRIKGSTDTGFDIEVPTGKYYVFTVRSPDGKSWKQFFADLRTYSSVTADSLPDSPVLEGDCLFVNGTPLGTNNVASSREGWSYSAATETLTLFGNGRFVLSGTNLTSLAGGSATNCVRIAVEAPSSTLVLSNLYVDVSCRSNCSAIALKDGVDCYVQLFGESILCGSAAGIAVPPDATLEIGPADESAEDVPTLYAYGGPDAAGIGTAYAKFYSGDESADYGTGAGWIGIDGVTVLAGGGWGIGGGNYRGGEDRDMTYGMAVWAVNGASVATVVDDRRCGIYAANVLVDGASLLVYDNGIATEVICEDGSYEVVDGFGTRVYPVWIDLSDNPAPVVRVTGSGLDNRIGTIDGSLCLWLPAGRHTLQIDGLGYKADVPVANKATRVDGLVGTFVNGIDVGISDWLPAGVSYDSAKNAVTFGQTGTNVLSGGSADRALDIFAAQAKAAQTFVVEKLTARRIVGDWRLASSGDGVVPELTLLGRSGKLAEGTAEIPCGRVRTEYGGLPTNVVISGGTVVANNLTGAANVQVTGGNVIFAGGRPHVTRDGNETAYLVTVILPANVRTGDRMALTDFLCGGMPFAYGGADLFVVEPGHVSFWLPNGAYAFRLGEQNYSVVVDGADAKAWPDDFFVVDGALYDSDVSVSNGTIVVKRRGDYTLLQQDGGPVDADIRLVPGSKLTVIGGLAETARYSGCKPDGTVDDDVFIWREKKPTEGSVVLWAYTIETGTFINDCDIGEERPDWLPEGVAYEAKTRQVTITRPGSYTLWGGLEGLELDFLCWAAPTLVIENLTARRITGDWKAVPAKGAELCTLTLVSRDAGGADGEAEIAGGLVLTESGGLPKTVTISGGTVFANGLTNADVRITGGNVTFTGGRPRSVTRDGETPVRLVAVSLPTNVVPGVRLELGDFLRDGEPFAYGGTDIVTTNESQFVNLWLPAGTYSFTLAGTRYAAFVVDRDVYAMPDDLVFGGFADESDIVVEGDKIVVKRPGAYTLARRNGGLIPYGYRLAMDVELRIVGDLPENVDTEGNVNISVQEDGVILLRNFETGTFVKEDDWAGAVDVGYCRDPDLVPEVRFDDASRCAFLKGPGFTLSGGLPEAVLDFTLLGEMTLKMDGLLAGNLDQQPVSQGRIELSGTNACDRLGSGAWTVDSAMNATVAVLSLGSQTAAADGSAEIAGGLVWTESGGLPKNVAISGGTVVANDLTNADVRITGGSVVFAGGWPKSVTRDGETPVWPVEVSLPGVVETGERVTLEDVTHDGEPFAYGDKDLFASDPGCVTLWLPAGSNMFTVAGTRYTAVVEEWGGVAMPDDIEIGGVADPSDVICEDGLIIFTRAGSYTLARRNGGLIPCDVFLFAGSELTVFGGLTDDCDAYAFAGFDPEAGPVDLLQDGSENGKLQLRAVNVLTGTLVNGVDVADDPARLPAGVTYDVASCTVTLAEGGTYLLTSGEQALAVDFVVGANAALTADGLTAGSLVAEGPANLALRGSNTCEQLGGGAWTVDSAPDAVRPTLTLTSPWLWENGKGEVTIAGGLVRTVHGGLPRAVTISGGTVVAEDLMDANVQITGGSVSFAGGQPLSVTRDGTTPVSRVNVYLPAGVTPGARVELGDFRCGEAPFAYGGKDLYAEDPLVVPLWLPDGDYSFSLGGTDHSAFVGEGVAASWPEDLVLGGDDAESAVFMLGGEIVVTRQGRYTLARRNGGLIPHDIWLVPGAELQIDGELAEESLVEAWPESGVPYEAVTASVRVAEDGAVILYGTVTLPDGYVPVWSIAPGSADKLPVDPDNALSEIFAFSVRENGKVVHEYVPCWNVKDNLAGLYDAVGGEFYGKPGYVCPHEPILLTDEEGNCIVTATGEKAKIDLENPEPTWTSSPAVKGGVQLNRCLSLTPVTELVVPETFDGKPVTAIGAGAFKSELLLRSLVLPASVESIENDAFAYCPNLRTIILFGVPSEPKGDVFLPADCTVYCYADHSPSTWAGRPVVKALSPDLFETTPIGENEVSIRLRQGASCGGKAVIPPYLNGGFVTAIENGAFRNSELTGITTPERVTLVGDSAFEGCSKLASVTLHEGVKTIGAKAFKDTAIRTITFPGAIPEGGREDFFGLDKAAAVGFVGKWDKAVTAMQLQGCHLVPQEARSIYEGPSSGAWNWLQSEDATLNFGSGWHALCGASKAKTSLQLRWEGSSLALCGVSVTAPGALTDENEPALDVQGSATLELAGENELSAPAGGLYVGNAKLTIRPANGLGEPKRARLTVDGLEAVGWIEVADGVELDLRGQVTCSGNGRLQIARNAVVRWNGVDSVRIRVPVEGVSDISSITVSGLEVPYGIGPGADDRGLVLYLPAKSGAYAFSVKHFLGQRQNYTVEIAEGDTEVVALGPDQAGTFVNGVDVGLPVAGALPEGVTYDAANRTVRIALPGEFALSGGSPGSALDFALESAATLKADGLTARNFTAADAVRLVLSGANAANSLAGGPWTIDSAAEDAAAVLSLGSRAEAADGSVVITGGIVRAQSGGLPKSVTISGGTVVANDLTNADVRITGGNVVFAGNGPRCVTRDGVTPVCPVLVLLQSDAAPGTRLELGDFRRDGEPFDYGVKDIFVPDEEEVWLWLPVGAYAFTIDGAPYAATVESGDEVSWADDLLCGWNGVTVRDGTLFVTRTDGFTLMRRFGGAVPYNISLGADVLLTVVDGLAAHATVTAEGAEGPIPVRKTVTAEGDLVLCTGVTETFVDGVDVGTSRTLPDGVSYDKETATVTFAKEAAYDATGGSDALALDFRSLSEVSLWVENLTAARLLGNWTVIGEALGEAAFLTLTDRGPGGEDGCVEIAGGIVRTESGGLPRNVLVSDGVLVANDLTNADVRITGGSVTFTGGRPNSVTRDGVTPVWPVTVKLPDEIEPGTQLRLTEFLVGADGAELQDFAYGGEEIYADGSGTLTLWLPRGAYSFELLGTTYTVTVAGVTIPPCGQIGPFETAEAAADAAKIAAVGPDAAVTAHLAKEDGAFAHYWRAFGFAVTGTAPACFVEAPLTDEARTHLAETAMRATGQLIKGHAPIPAGTTAEVTVTGCEPGFYYSLYTDDLVAAGGENLNRLCGLDGQVSFTLTGGTKGRFGIGVWPVGDVRPGDQLVPAEGEAHPHAVQDIGHVLTVPPVAHASVEVKVNGAVEDALENAFYAIPDGVTVKVSFRPVDPGYELAGESTFTFGPVKDDIAFGAGGPTAPTVKPTEYKIDYLWGDGTPFTDWADGVTPPTRFTVESAATLPTAKAISLDSLHFTFNGWTNSLGQAFTTTKGVLGNLVVYAVGSRRWTLTVPTVAHTTVRVTASDGSEIAPRGAGVYVVPHGETVTVAYTADPHYELNGESLFQFVCASGDIAFGEDGPTMPTTKPSEYQIRYLKDDGKTAFTDWADGVTPPTRFTVETEVTLPTENDVMLRGDDLVFGGWTNSLGRTVATTKNLVGDLTVFAKTVRLQLPPGYEPVEYIESTAGGGQYIDTGYVPNVNTRIVADFNPLAKGENWLVFFGVTGNDSASDGVLLRYYDNTSINGWFCNSSYSEATIGGCENKRVMAELKAGGMTLDGTAAAITTTGTPYNGPIYLFCGNNGGSAWRHQAMKLYSFKIYEGATLKRKFVPCIETATGEVGLYDVADGGFYGNAGSGACFDTPRTKVPPGYMAVEYIESDELSGQYIDTEYVPSMNTRIVADFMPRSKIDNGMGFFGVMGNGASGNVLLRYADDSNNINGCFCNSNWDEAQIGGLENTRITAELKAGGMTLNGTTAAISTTGTIPWNTGSIHIFCVNSDQGGGCQPMRLYSFKIYEGATLKRDFVPCVDTSGHWLKTGLWDAVGQKAYWNLGGNDFIFPGMISAGNIDEFRTLKDGRVYTFGENVEFNAPATESAMTVESGATVTLVIPKGVTVTLKGGDANGQTGAGAGIEVPSNAKLIVCGEGTLNATGGNAAGGAYGAQGEPASCNESTEYITSASGGHGGGGGGGAGAGIGGKGGNGGAGGAGGRAVTSYWEAVVSGEDGGNGTGGTAGATCGTVVVRGNVKLLVGGGGAGSHNGYNGGAYRNWMAIRGGYWSYAGYAGGGGGGGGAGGSAPAIGGGAGGGGGGAGGGSGGVSYYHQIEDLICVRMNGGRGNGGYAGEGVDDGEPGTAGQEVAGREVMFDNQVGIAESWTDPYYSEYVGGSSGSGGAAGAKGGDGTLRVSTTACVNDAGGTAEDPTVNGTSIWAMAGDGWTFDSVSGKVRITKPRVYLTTGEVVFENAQPVVLSGLKANATLAVSGLPGVKSLTTDGTGSVSGLFFPSGVPCAFSVGESRFAFTVGNAPVSATAMPFVYSAWFTLGEHVQKVSYTTVPAVTSGTATDDFVLDGLPKGTKITLNVTCDGEYEYRGEKVWTVGTADMDVALTAVHGWFDRVAYCDAQGKPQAATDVRDFSTRADNVLGGGKWYLVHGTVETESLTVQGSAHLILADGAKLTVTGGDDEAGVAVAAGNSLTIWGQTFGTGELVATGGKNAAGIGGCAYEGSGAVTINGGTVTVTGGWDGAGIGSGSGVDQNRDDSGNMITINGGRVKAGGTGCGAGLGGGWKQHGGELVINGGTVEAVGGTFGGFPLGDRTDLPSPLMSVKINGGSVLADKTDTRPVNGQGAALYCVTVEGLERLGRLEGLDGYGMRDVVPTNGSVYLWLPNGRHVFSIDGVTYVAEVADSDTTAAECVPVTLSGLKANATLAVSGLEGVETLTTDGTGSVTLQLFRPGSSYAFTVGDGRFAFTAGGSVAELRAVYSAAFTLGEGIQSVGYTTVPDVAKGTATDDFVVDGLPLGTRIVLDVSCDNEYEYFGETELTVGTSNLTVALAAKHVGFARVGYRDAAGTEREAQDVWDLDAFVRETSGTGIVLGDDQWYVVRGTNEIGSLTVEGSANLILADGAKLTVTGGVNEAAVAVAAGNSLTIWGQTLGTGELVAKNTWGPGGSSGACIGGADGVDGGAVTVNGGIVTAISEGYGAGIGGGDRGAGGVVTVNGGRVTARGLYSAGIGGGANGDGGTVTINGGTVDASHICTAADIGGGYQAAGATVTINGGSVKAETIQNAPVNGAGMELHCVVVEVERVETGENVENGERVEKGENGERLRIEGLEGYGTRDIVPIDGKVYLWLPNGKYEFTVDGVRYRAEVADANTTAERVETTLSVTPGELSQTVFATEEAAASAMVSAVLVPSEAVGDVLPDDTARQKYCNMFTFKAVATSDGAWAVEAVLTPEAESNLVENATAAVRQIPLAEIAAMPEEGSRDVKVEGCEPGFYYTLYGGQGLTALPETGTEYGPVLCGPTGEVVFPEVKKPSDAAGFFMIKVSEERGGKR